MAVELEARVVTLQTRLEITSQEMEAWASHFRLLGRACITPAVVVVQHASIAEEFQVEVLARAARALVELDQMGRLLRGTVWQDVVAVEEAARVPLVETVVQEQLSSALELHQPSRANQPVVQLSTDRRPLFR